MSESFVMVQLAASSSIRDGQWAANAKMDLSVIDFRLVNLI